MAEKHMTREDYETQLFIDNAVKRFHDRTKSYPTKDEAIRRIVSGRKTCFLNTFSVSERAIQARSRYLFATAEIIRYIRESPEGYDPIRIIYNFWSDMDDMVTSSNNSITWIFAGGMRDEAIRILELLG